MKAYIVNVFFPAVAVVLLFGLLISAGAAQQTELITKDELQKILTNADTYVLDVRTGRDWGSSDFKFKGAHRANPEEFSTWSTKFPKSGTMVLYCA